MRVVFCWLQLLCLVLAGMTAVSAHAEQDPAAASFTLLGKIDGNIYYAPDELFNVALPFAKYEPGRHIVTDGVLAGSLNVLFEDTVADQRYRIELSELPETTPRHVKQAAEVRLAAYQGLLQRAFTGTPLPIHFGSPAEQSWAYYYRQDGQDSRYHLFVFFRLNQHLAMLWTDFTESDVTPALEDSVINGEHPAVQATYAFYKTLARQ